MIDFKKGPFSMVDGKPQDAAIFKDELSVENESRVDNAIFQKELKKKATEEKARRASVNESINESFNTLMEVF